MPPLLARTSWQCFWRWSRRYITTTTENLKSATWKVAIESGTVKTPLGRLMPLLMHTPAVPQPESIQLTIAGDNTSSNEVWRNLQAGFTVLFIGHRHNLHTLYSALNKRLRQEEENALTGAPSAQGIPAAQVFSIVRKQAQRRATMLSRFVIGATFTGEPILEGRGLTSVAILTRIIKSHVEQTTIDNRGSGDSEIKGVLLPYWVLLGLRAAEQYEKKGIIIPSLSKDQPIYPRFNVLPPTRLDYIELFANYLKQHFQPTPTTALEIGTGTGILTFLLIKHGQKSIIATDTNPHAVECARGNASNILRNLIAYTPDNAPVVSFVQCNPLAGILDTTDSSPHVGFAELQSAVRAATDARLEVPSSFNLIVSNPPWIPGRAETLLETAVYDPNEQFLRGLLRFASRYLSPSPIGRLIMLYSDLAQRLGLQEPQRIEKLCKEEQLNITLKQEAQYIETANKEEEEPVLYSEPTEEDMKEIKKREAMYGAVDTKSTRVRGDNKSSAVKSPLMGWYDLGKVMSKSANKEPATTTTADTNNNKTKKRDTARKDPLSEYRKQEHIQLYVIQRSQ